MGNRICKRVRTTTDVTNTFYVRDASGNTMATYKQTSPNSLSLQEFSLYGSADKLLKKCLNCFGKSPKKLALNFQSS